MMKKKEVKKTSKKRVVKMERPGTKKVYYRAIEVVVALNEKIVAGEERDDDPLWDELKRLRHLLVGDQDSVISRLIYSLAVGATETVIDESTPGSDAHWK